MTLKYSVGQKVMVLLVDEDGTFTEGNPHPCVIIDRKEYDNRDYRVVEIEPIEGDTLPNYPFTIFEKEIVSLIE